MVAVAAMALAGAQPDSSAGGPTSLTVAITALTSSVAPNGDATLTAATSPGATCTPTITYHSGEVSKAQGLDTQVATSGTVSWTWTVGPRTGAGTATAAVRCTLDGQSQGTSRTFQVT